jgi:hypothetical protein
LLVVVALDDVAVIVAFEVDFVAVAVRVVVVEVELSLSKGDMTYSSSVFTLPVIILLTLSRTCISPLLVLQTKIQSASLLSSHLFPSHFTYRTLSCVTFASLKYISPPFVTVTLTVSLLKLVNICPSARKLEYKGMGMVWKANAVVRVEMLAFVSGFPAERKASLEGPRQVTLLSLSRIEERPVRLRDVERDERPQARIVWVHISGRVTKLCVGWFLDVV